MRHKRTGPALATEIPYVGIAQLVEYLIAIQKVAGSNPVTHSKKSYRGVWLKRCKMDRVGRKRG